MAFEAPVSAQPALEDNLSAIFGLGSDAKAAPARAPSRRHVPALIAGFLVVACGGAFLAFGPWSGLGGDDQEVASGPVSRGAPAPEIGRSVPAPEPTTSADSGTRVAGDVAPISAGDEPSLAAPAPSSRGSALAADAADRGSSAANRSATPNPGEARTAVAGRSSPPKAEQKQPTRSATATARPPIPDAPATPTIEEAPAIDPPPPNREQSAVSVVAIADQAAPGDDQAERASRRQAKRREERKVLDSFDAMRMLRRQ